MDIVYIFGKRRISLKNIHPWQKPAIVRSLLAFDPGLAVLSREGTRTSTHWRQWSSAACWKWSFLLFLVTVPGLTVLSRERTRTSTHGIDVNDQTLSSLHWRKSLSLAWVRIVLGNPRLGQTPKILEPTLQVDFTKFTALRCYLNKIKPSYQLNENPEDSSPDLLSNRTFSQFVLISSLHPGRQQAVVQAVIGTLHIIPSNINIWLYKNILSS